MHTYILNKGTITVPNTATASASVNNTNQKYHLKIGPFTDCITEINNIKVDDAKNLIW